MFLMPSHPRMDERAYGGVPDSEFKNWEERDLESGMNWERIGTAHDMTRPSRLESNSPIFWTSIIFTKLFSDDTLPVDITTSIYF